jgi:predicted SAM-dependent methyltransferase
MADNPRPTFGERIKGKLVRLGRRQIGSFQRRFNPPSLPVNADGRLLLHVGCGMVDAAGFVNIDMMDAPHIHIQRPIDDLSLFADGCADLVYASHCLEHFGYRHSRSVVQEWARVLRREGVLRVAVPDFAVLAHAYAAGAPLRDVQGPLLGGQDYRLNFHAAVFDEQRLRELMEEVGLTDIRRWEPETVDHHDFTDESGSVCRIGDKDVKISLNLEGRKQ